ncbi:MAG TPA: pyridoxamine 5'-phosphate oxidase family protein [Opitutaceae bacterium]|nr:pyridoxamine 5'-phosphate oxidase family protein [Opitutaceae bacterium]
MAKFFSELAPAHRAFIAAQKIYFVASAPHTGRVNLSPKGLDTFRVLSAGRVGYLDGTGSGNETAAHLAENGRVTFMFCSFDAEPLILRLYARGRVVHPRDAEWAQLRPLFGPPLAGERQIVVAELESAQTSCGFAVPFFDFRAHRSTLTDWCAKKGPDGIATYWAEKNQRSIDGLPTGLLE